MLLVFFQGFFNSVLLSGFGVGNNWLGCGLGLETLSLHLSEILWNNVVINMILMFLHNDITNSNTMSNKATGVWNIMRIVFVIQITRKVEIKQANKLVLKTPLIPHKSTCYSFLYDITRHHQNQHKNLNLKL